MTHNEVNAMSLLDNLHIIKQYTSGEALYTKKNSQKEPKKVRYIVLELAQGGCLFDIIAQTGRFTEDLARYYFK
jgi:serine/threonine protein kinase